MRTRAEWLTLGGQGAGMAFDPVPIFQKLTAPILFIWGEQDSMVPAAASRAAMLLLARGGSEGLTTSLHAAVKFGHRAMTQWLLAHGADSQVKNFQGQTPLEVAVAQGDTEIVAILRAHNVAG